MGAPEASLTPGTQVTLVIPATFSRSRGGAAEVTIVGHPVGLRLDRHPVHFLPAGAPEILRQALADAAAFWAPTRCPECIRVCVPCEDCAGDPDMARMYGLLADALEGRAAEPLWERAGKGGRVSVRVTVTRAGEKPWEAGKLNTGPLEAAGFLAGVVDRLRALARGGSGE